MDLWSELIGALALLACLYVVPGVFDLLARMNRERRARRNRARAILARAMQRHPAGRGL